MARQRFIWPTLWDDPDLGRLTPEARLLYIACFSNADDDGRLIGDPTYLRSIAFRYQDVTSSDILTLRSELEKACGSFRVYEHNGAEYVSFANWTDFQKPKYPTPSKLPPPPGYRKKPRKPAPRKRLPSGNGSGMVPEDSGNGSEPVPNHSPTGGVGLGRVGLGTKAEERELQTSAKAPTAKSLPFSQELLVSRLLHHIGSHADDGTENVIRSYATHLPEATIAKVLESSETTKPRDRAAYIVAALRNEIDTTATPEPDRIKPPADFLALVRQPGVPSLPPRLPSRPRVPSPSDPQKETP